MQPHQYQILRGTSEGTYIVAVRILHKSKRIVRDLVDELDTLMLRGVVDATLQHAATVAMSSDLDAVGRNSVVDELSKHHALVRLMYELRPRMLT